MDDIRYGKPTDCVDIVFMTNNTAMNLKSKKNAENKH